MRIETNYSCPCVQRQTRANTRVQLAIGFAIGFAILWRDSCWPITQQTNGKPKQTQFLFDGQMETALKHGNNTEVKFRKLTLVDLNSQLVQTNAGESIWN